MLRRARAPRLRSMRAFAAAEITLPDGPHRGRRFRCARQPYTGLWFDLVDSQAWPRMAAVGPTQSGKTLAAFIVPCLYHLFEIGENVICGVPDMRMAGDKWREDLLPVIRRTRYAELIPSRGAGSRGGKVSEIEFRNGATLKFMSGGGGDKSRAGFTSRVLVVTEADGLDTPGSTSREADKLTQLEGRLRADPANRREYLECTASIEEGRIWQEYTTGTATAIRLHCPHCAAWVTPEREHLLGWQDAEDEIAAEEAATFACPECAALWSEADRRLAHADAIPLHRGQEITADGQVTGQAPRTRTLGFRWSGVNNFFTTAALMGAEEWRAARAVDEDGAEREMRQFVWALPAQPLEEAETPLDSRVLIQRRDKWPRGICPPDTEYLTVGADIGKRVGYWAALAYTASRRIHLVEYGSFEIQSDDLGLTRAIVAALRDFRDRCAEGWPVDGSGDYRQPNQVWVDSSYEPDTVRAWAKEAGHGPRGRFQPIRGQGASQRRNPASYRRPQRTTRAVRRIGTGWHLVRLDTPGAFHVLVDVDHWKTWTHARLATPADQPGALVFYSSLDQNEHTKLAKHLTAERQVTEYRAGKGHVTRWVQVSRQNHWLDCVAYAGAAGDWAGFRLVDTAKAGPQAPDQAAGKWWTDQRRKRRGGRR